MKKALLVSFFESGNMGDILIAENIVNILSRKYELTFCDTSGNIINNTCLLSFNNASLSFKKLVLSSQFVRDIFSRVKNFRKPYIANLLENSKNFDTVIFAGGNMIMDLGFFSDSTKILFNTICELKKENKKIIFLFCGFGPFKSLKGERYFKDIIKFADYVTVRDEYSYNLIKKQLPEKEVEIWRDPVLLFDDITNVDSAEKIGVNVFFGVGRYQKTKMKRAYISLISKLRTFFPEKEILLFSTEAMDYSEISIIKKKFAMDNFVRIEKIVNKEELFNLYKKVEFIIAARMHTAITAIISNIPIIAIAWQGKVSSLMSALNLKENCFTVSEFDKKQKEVLNQIIEILNDINYFREKQHLNRQIIKAETTEKIEKFLEI